MCPMGAHHVVSISVQKKNFAPIWSLNTLFWYRKLFYIFFQNLDFWNILLKGNIFGKNSKNCFSQILCVMSGNTFLSQNRFFFYIHFGPKSLHTEKQYFYMILTAWSFCACSTPVLQLCSLITLRPVDNA